MPYSRSSAASSSLGIATSGLTSRPVTMRNAPIVYSSVGSAIASASSCSSSLQRQRARLAQEARRDALLEDRELGIAGGVDQRQPELRGERLGDVALRDERRA